MTFVPSGFFVLRTPLLPFDDFLAWGDGLAAPGATEGLERALAADRSVLRARLRNVIERPEVREALFVASPDLEESIGAWLREPEGDRGQRVERALVRYFSRMSGRETPFGLFAGCSTGVIGSETRLEIGGRGTYQRHTRFDMNYLCGLAEALARDPDVRKSLVLRPNSSHYRAGRRLRYAEGRVANGARTYHLVAVESTPYLMDTLARAKHGARAAELAEALVAGEAGVSIDEALEYVNELIDSQILVPDLHVAVTGREPIHGLIESLRTHATADIAGCVEQAGRYMSALDAEGLGVASARYKEIAAGLDQLPSKAQLSKLFQVDMVKPAPAAALGNEVIAEIVRAVEILHRIGSRNVQPQFAEFKEAFLKRYEGREVPLVEALDEEVGVGFQRSRAPGAEASPLLHGLPLASGVADAPRWKARDAFLFRKVEDAVRSGAREVALEESDLGPLASEDRLTLPDAFAVTATLCAASEAAVARGEFQISMGMAAGPSGGRLLGRFCHADERLREFVEGHLRSEEACDPEAIFAEIVHLPEGRLGNVLCRPVLREYEIPFLGASGAPPDRQIPITDLMVRVEGGRIVLRSLRLGRRVIPRLTSAHTYTRRSMGLYRFLGMLQEQGVSCSVVWLWGHFEAARFLPRLRVGRVVLSPARWRLDTATLRALGAARGDERFQAVQKWREEWGLPRHVVLADSDNELPIDLDNALSVETFVELVRKRTVAFLKEMYPGPEEMCVRGPEGRFVHEIVVPFVRAPETLPVAHTAGVEVSSCIARRFPPGSEWVYAKLYTGSASADMVLTEAVSPLVRGAIGSGAADRWFFIRYADPDWHLRLRLHGDPSRLLSEVLPALHAALEPLIRDGLIWRVQLDTYEREVERYGGAQGIDLAERIFHVDSEAALAILNEIEGDPGADIRWRLALRGIDMLLSDLGLNPEARRKLVGRQCDGLRKELRAGKSLAIQMGERFRKERKELERLCDPGYPEDGALAPAMAPLAARSSRLVELFEELKTQERAGRLTVPLADQAADFVHMHVNRLLRSEHRAQELVLYDFAERLYASRAARVTGRAPRERDPARQP